jgi:hypothetical protein
MVGASTNTWVEKPSVSRQPLNPFYKRNMNFDAKGNLVGSSTDCAKSYRRKK